MAQDNVQDSEYVYTQYQDAGTQQPFQVPIIPSTAIVSINGLSGPTVTLSGGTTGFSYAVAGLTLNLTGVLVPANGGTGQSSYAVGDLLYASATTTLAKLADVATGNALISGGVTAAPAWGKIGLTTHVSGVLPNANGGMVKINSSTIAPTVNNDNTQGYARCSLWVNTTSPTGYICLDAATGAAIWQIIA